jgi:hypothetical protein
MTVLPRTWLRGFQLLLSLLAAGTFLVTVFWIVGSLYYLVKLGGGATDVTVGATLPKARLLGLESVVPGLVPGTTVSSSSEIAIAIRDPGPIEYGLALLQHLPTLAVYTTFFVLLLRSVRSAERSDPFGADHARRVRRLGWFLVIAALASALVEAVARGLLADRVLVQGRFAFDFDFPTGAIVGGIGLLAVAEILRRGERLREDLEGVV